MKILFASSEAVPYSKTGGLGDVVGALVLALKQKKHDVRLLVPKYRGIDAEKFGLKKLPVPLQIPLGDTIETVHLWEGRLARSIPVYFLDAPKYFDRDGYYRDADTGVDFPDNDERFILFSRAVLETAKAVDFRADVFHCHDWQTGLVPAFLSTVYRFDAFFQPAASVFTVHNIAYQGVFPKNALFLAGLSWADFTPDRLEFYDQVNFMKAGLVYSNIVNTVSPAYAKEVQSGPEFGRGMEGILLGRAKDFFGVLNGIDEKEWDPARDAHLAQRYTVKQAPARRAVCKRDLQETCGLEVDPKAPLLGMVSRLDPQKGFDMLLAGIEALLLDGAQLTVLGQGEPEFHEALEKLAKDYPGRAAFCSDFNEPLAHKIYAGSDLFVMPSRFEPCGLGQMIALRYGAVPVVTPTGGLTDTVSDAGSPDGKGIGFVTEDISPAALKAALDRAIALYRDRPDAWNALVARGMNTTFGWGRSVLRYIELYKLAVSRKLESQK